MKKVFGLLILVLAVSFLSAGCNKGGDDEAAVYPACSSTSDCAAKGEVCVDKMCKECGKSSDCKTPCTACKGNKCEAVEGCCSGDADCPQGQVCMAKPGKKTGKCGTK